MMAGDWGMRRQVEEDVASPVDGPGPAGPDVRAQEDAADEQGEEDLTLDPVFFEV
jgi:hypothetical protein